MTKIGVFENVLADLKDGFELINDYDFENTLLVDYFTSSQDFGDLKGVEKYDLLFIDIALSSNSDLDGIYLIKKIKELKGIKIPKLIVITGQTKINDLLREHQIQDVKVTQKPFIAEEVVKLIKEAIN